MPTQDQFYQVDFGQGGLDTKTDTKRVIPTNFTTLTNQVFTNPGKLKKINGFDQLTSSILPSGSISSGQNLAVFNDELLLLGNSSVYAYSEADTAWISKGNLTPIQSTSSILLRNSYSQSQMDSAVTGNYQIFSWVDTRGGIRCIVKDLLSKSIVLSDTDIGAASGSINPKCFALTATKFGIFYLDYNATSIKVITVTVPAMTISAASTVNGNAYYFDLATGPSFNVITFKDVGGQIKVAKFDTTGAITSSVTSSFSDNPVSIGCVIDPATSNIFVGYCKKGASYFNFYGAVYNSALTEIVANTAFTIDGYFPINSSYPPITGIITAANTATWFYDGAQQYSTTGATNTGVWKNTLTSAGVVGTHTLFEDYVSLASKAFTVGSFSYVNVVHTSIVQATLFTVRSDGFVAAKMLQATAGDNAWTSGILPSVNATATNVYSFATQFKNQIANTTTTTTGSSDPSQNVYIIYGLAAASLDFTGATPYQSVQVNGTTLITGGVTSMYDGLALVEQGFHLYPELLVLTAGSYKPFSLTVFQIGDGSHKELFTIGACSAEFIRAGDYFTLSSAADANKYYYWFKKDGLGSDPALATRTGLLVSIQSNWNATQVCNAIWNASTLLGIVPTRLTDTTIQFQNSVNGSCTAPTNSVAVPSIPAATYQYCAIYEWLDNQGQIHRSAPSVAKSIINGGTQAVQVQVNNLTLTEKKALSARADINIAVYRNSVASPTIFNRVSSLINRPINDPVNGGFTTITDIFTDTEISVNELLYTNGGILYNSPPPSSTLLLKTKNRVWLYCPETKNLWFSKQVAQSVGVQFSDLLTSIVDSSNELVTLLAELDEKIVIYKANQPLFIFGDGPNDTGQGQSFSLPQPIVAPTGASDSNSGVKVPSGIIVKSARGFFQLNRMLQATYIGGPVEGFNASKVLSAELLPALSQVRFLLDSNEFLIYDYERGVWMDRPVASTVTDAVLWKRVYTILKTNGLVWTESTSSFQDNAVSFSTVSETGWIQVGGIQNYQRAKAAYIIGDYKSTHTLTVQVGYDFSTSYAGNDTYVFTPANQQPMQARIHLRQQKCEALRFKVTTSGASGEGNSISGISLLIGLKAGGMKLPSGQRG